MSTFDPPSPPTPSKRPRLSHPPAPNPNPHSALLNTINRSALDFDPPPICSVTLRAHNLYACLLCGRFFQGRAPNTPAHTHALHESHHLFIDLSTALVYALPHDIEIDAAGDLCDIRRALHPRFTAPDLPYLDLHTVTLPTTPPRIRGAVGLDAMHASNAPAVVLQLVLRPPPVRNALLLHRPRRTNPPLHDALAVVCASIWADAAFRPHIAPHAFMQILSREAILNAEDPVDVLAWILNTASKGTTDARKFGKLLKKVFQGKMRVTSRPDSTPDTSDDNIETKDTPFWFLSLDLPPKPLFKHQMESDIVPQTALEKLMEKFNGVKQMHVIETGASKSYQIIRTPRYLLLVLKRFSKSKFGVEKNPSIVHLPSDLLDVGIIWKSVNCKYRLIGTVSHEGSLEKGRFKVAVFHEASKSWYDVTDISVEKTVFQLISLRDSYVLLYEMVVERNP